MSRIGKLPIQIPSGVTITVADDAITVVGPKGQLVVPHLSDVIVSQEDGNAIVTRKNDERIAKAQHGLQRALLNNAVDGVTKGFEKKLEVNGVGFRINGGGQETKNADWANFYAAGQKEAAKPRPGVFEYRDKQTNRWANVLDRGVWIKGFWRIPWQNEAVRIAKIDTTAQTITLSVPVSGGIGNKYTRPEGNGKEPYWLMNLLEEVDQPGEWAVDFKDKKLVALLDKLDTVHRAVETNQLSLSEVFEIALVIEMDLAERHIESILTYGEYGLSDLFIKMEKYDQGHLALLQKAVDSLRE